MRLGDVAGELQLAPTATTAPASSRPGQRRRGRASAAELVEVATAALAEQRLGDVPGEHRTARSRADLEATAAAAAIAAAPAAAPRRAVEIASAAAIATSVLLERARFASWAPRARARAPPSRLAR